MRFSVDDGGMSAALTELSHFAAETAIKQTINMMSGDLKAISPYKTGELRNSLRQEVQPEEGTIGFTASYAPYVEYGHRQNVGQYVPAIGKRLKAAYVPGQHFFQKEVAATRTVFPRLLQQDVERAVR
jgi:hypothetical protein